MNVNDIIAELEQRIKLHETKSITSDYEDGYCDAYESVLPKLKQIGEGSESMSDFLNSKGEDDYGLYAEEEMTELKNEKSYWKKRCEGLIGVLQLYFDLMSKSETEQHFEHLLQEHDWNNKAKAQLKSGEETEGQDELWNELFNLFLSYFQEGQKDSNGLIEVSKKLYTLIKKQ